MMISDLLTAICFSADRHSAQRRKGPTGVPYINHLVEVASLLANVGNVQNRDTLIAAVLHDIVEDTTTTLEEVAQLFGTRARELVDAVSDDKSLSKEERKRLVLFHLANADDAIKLIKLADLCSNVSSIPADWDKERLQNYFDWSLQAASLCAGVNPALDALFLSRWQTSKDASMGLPK